MLESNNSKLIQNKLTFIKGTNIPLPSLVEISNSGMCNRKCSFCPRSNPDYPDLNEFISDELHTKLCAQLSECGFEGVYAYAGFNEPLLHKKIYKHIEEARKFLPNARIEVITNGDVLNPTRIKKLIDAGLTTLSISAYDGLEQAESYQKMCEDVKLRKDQFIVRHRYLPPEENFGINLTNRGGTMKNAVYKISSLDKALKESCYYPSYDFFVDYNGDILMCSHDWAKKNILGNLTKQSFIDIWTSEKAKTSRKNLYEAKRSFAPCNICNAKGDHIGPEHVKAWKNLY
jgi:radical SAM protein with 4Fe4S-binding SPASM domain